MLSHAAFPSFRLSVLVTVCVLALFVSPASAQTVTTGTVLLPRGHDTVPLPDVRVLLHRVGRTAQGPVDSARTDAAGRFRFRFRPDTSAIYLLSTRHGGIEYFSPPVATNPARPDTGIRLMTYDSSSTAPVRLEARHIVVPRPGDDGARSVLDLLVIRNPGILARVSPDSMHPSWTFRLPAGTGEMQVGESDVSPDAVVRQDDSIMVFAPIAPGDKQLTVEYAVAPHGGRLAFPMPQGATVNLLVEDREVAVQGAGLALADTQQIEGRSFRRWSGRVAPGETITLVWSAPGGGARRVLAGLVAAVVLALAVVVWRYLRRPRPAAAPLAGPDRLLDAIAALDARFAGREAETPAEEWRAYEAERARLKAELEAALAAASPAG